MNPEELQSIFEECKRIIYEEIIDEDGSSYACKIHDVFGEIEGNQHNCLGCNFDESSTLITKFLDTPERFEDVQQDTSVYLLLLYLLVERIDTVLKLIEFDEVYRREHFGVFQRIRKWANFIKHPKSFILTHHPAYDFENGDTYDIAEYDVVINDRFVFKYYSYDDRTLNAELLSLLRNNQKTIVTFPEPINLTKDFCDAYKRFINVIIEDPTYKSKLNDNATIEEYFSTETSISPSPSDSLSASPSPELEEE